MHRIAFQTLPNPHNFVSNCELNAAINHSKEKQLPPISPHLHKRASFHLTQSCIIRGDSVKPILPNKKVNPSEKPQFVKGMKAIISHSTPLTFTEDTIQLPFPFKKKRSIKRKQIETPSSKIAQKTINKHKKQKYINIF